MPVCRTYAGEKIRKSVCISLYALIQPTLGKGSFDHDVGAAVDHPPEAATVSGGVALADQRDAVDPDLGAAFDAGPGIGPAADGVYPRIAHAESRFPVDEYVGRGGDGRAGDIMGATGIAVGVGGAVRPVPQTTGGFGHGGLLVSFCAVRQGIVLWMCI